MMKFDGDKIICEGIVSESWTMQIKNFLETIAPSKIHVDLSECKDMHTAVAQILIAYSIAYSCEYEFGSQNAAYAMLLKGAKAS